MDRFMNEDFLLQSPTAKTLYEDYGKDEPIFDFHCHLSPQEIYEDRAFEDLAEAWLGGDHYKWRIMRAYGIDEELITGSAPGRDKFRAYAEALSHAIGNPLYHWSHMELRHFFDIDDVLDAQSADAIFDRANELLASGLTARKMMEMSGVNAVFTTDDPADDLAFHKKLRDEGVLRVYPAYRPDKYLAVGDSGFAAAVSRLSAIVGRDITSYKELLEALKERMEAFEALGCRASDHALASYDYVEADEAELEAIFQSGLSGDAISSRDINAYITASLQFLAREYAARGWPMQLHIQSIRNNNPPMFEKLGPDTGYDSILDGDVARPINALLGSLEATDELPKVILFSLNPADFPILCTLMGNFQKGPDAGKLQLGPAWWHLDHLPGMVQHLEVLASQGVLSTFVGMLTDSRSFLSYPRHDYFRRILCNFLGDLVESGQYPAKIEFLGQVVSDICYANSWRYFRMDEEA